jgi:cellulose synthase/poly-beta-1,6-N-acetylglucosamine synthase-like glycosyltransferase
VIIPVRNEATGIAFLLQDLLAQSYPETLLEVIVVDDSSTDSTVDVVNSIIATTNKSISLIQLPLIEKPISPKKRAINTAIMRASGSLILTTDGDCRVGPDWVASVVAMYEKTGAKLISGPVTFQREKLLTDYLQTVEFSSLIGSGASSMAMGVASMCNGANLAYQKSIFEEVEGFKGNEHIASGDDEFLMHKIATKYPKDLYFLKSPQAIVQTVAHKNWSGFYGQRKRWASKWKHYNNPLTIALAIYVFSCNASLVILPLLGLLGILSWKLVGVLFILKWVPEWLFIGGVLSFLKKLTSIPFIPLVQILYPFYVTLFGLVAQKPTYLWKDRRLQ